MRFLTDENLGSVIPQKLRELGFDVVSVSEVSPAEKDPKILNLTNTQTRILITLDKDFGELVFKDRLTHSGVIFLRFKDESVKNKFLILSKVLKLRKEFQNKFTVIREKSDGKLTVKQLIFKI